MKHQKIFKIINSKGQHFIIVCISLITILNASVSGQTLEEKFLSPPNYAKPRGYWLWAHGNFDYATISRELKEFREKGLGGVDIFDMGIGDPLDVIPSGPAFLSEEQLDGIEYALKEAKKLELAMGISVSNGWNAGGSWTEPEDASMQLLLRSDTIRGPARLNEIAFPDVPRSFKKAYGDFKLYPQFDENGFPKYYKDVCLLAFPLTESGIITDTARVIRFDVKEIKGNRVNITLPQGDWIVTRAVVTNTGQQLWVQSDNSTGYIMDHFSRKATYNHFNSIINNLESRVGDLGESSLERLYIASYESEAPIGWTPELPQEFLNRNGYHIEKFIPALAGIEVIDAETTERFLHDYRMIISEMFINNHYKQASQICRDHGILVASESGGPGPPLHNVPTEDLKALGAVDIMRGEFWNKHARWFTGDGLKLNLMQVVKNIGSAAHIYGHKVVEMEAFTSHGFHWQESPFELKPLADRAFCEGMTRIVYHTMPHSPPEAGLPGWSYQAGTHVHPKMTWWDMSVPFHRYLARCGALLMEGLFVADVAYYYGNHIPNFARPKHIRPDLGPGYEYDDLNTEVLLQTTEVIDGRIRLPCGMEYEILVLPDDQRMDLDILKKAEELLQKGATVIGPKPTMIYGLGRYLEKEKELKLLADKIWGKGSRTKKIDRKYGKGRIIAGKMPREVLNDKGIVPDIQYHVDPANTTLDYIHRRTATEEIYFLRNVDSVYVNTEVQFRVKGLQPEIWDPVNGSMKREAVYLENENGILIPIAFEPLGSIFIIFKKTGARDKHIEKVICNDTTVFPATSGLRGGFNTWIDEQGITFSAEIPGNYEFTFSNGQAVSITASENQVIQRMDQIWDVRFPYGWGVDPVQKWEKLTDWTQSGDVNLKHFSGTATYRTSFTLKENEFPQHKRVILDLGEVGFVAHVYLNGKEAGISIFPPHQIDVTELLRQGENYMVVEVANTWLNRLIGDIGKPLNEQYTRSNVSNGSDPDQRPWKDRELQRSGLIGPVILKSQKNYKL